MLCGRYELRRVVADGGTGRVYEGVDRQSNSRVAVKVLHDHVARDAVALRRFKREYAISSQLPDEFIVRVLDFQQDASTKAWLLVMEFLDGEELRMVLDRDHCVPPPRLVRILSHVALGLDEAHRRNFIHRDLKPDNLFLCGAADGDHVKLLDFGSVKDTNINAPKLTLLGTTIGSPYYMAPEQAEGLETLDARADVFALAAITYECLTGSVPFAGENSAAILLAVLMTHPPPVSTVAHAELAPLPPDLDDVIDDALAKNPSLRTPRVGDFVTAVGRAFGLAGDHAQWARMSAQELGREMAAVRDRGRGAAQLRSVDPASAHHVGAGVSAATSQARPARVAVNGVSEVPAGLPRQETARARASHRRWLVGVALGALVLGVIVGSVIVALRGLP